MGKRKPKVLYEWKLKKGSKKEFRRKEEKKKKAGTTGRRYSEKGTLTREKNVSFFVRLKKAQKVGGGADTHGKGVIGGGGESRKGWSLRDRREKRF